MKALDPICPPSVAGRFYPGDPGELGAFVNAALERGCARRGVVRAVVAPHAGYVFSGDLCGRVYGAVSRAPKRRKAGLPATYGSPALRVEWYRAEKVSE